MRHKVTAEGLQPDKEKIEAIASMPPPEDKQALQRYLGMVKYLAQYIPHESTITEPLRSLLRKETPWIWGPKHDAAMQKINNMLTTEPVLSYYDVNQDVTIQCDSSQKGMGACLLQDGKPIAYASRTMTPTEQNWAQIGKEMLVIVFVCDKFHQYIYGKVVNVQSDHKPLETIMAKPLAKATPRLQHMMLRLQHYTFNVRFVARKYLYVADMLSRVSLKQTDQFELLEEIEVMVHSLMENMLISPKRMQEFKALMTEDSVLQKLSKIVKSGQVSGSGGGLFKIPALLTFSAHIKELCCTSLQNWLYYFWN